ncbi:MAG: PorP/SprF family type IX secretion system membrane protein [Bacteroidales bacterium]|nr:PorP/SprF family type IX secretion system membrane protein [Bacteroidales bacterium]
MQNKKTKIFIALFICALIFPFAIHAQIDPQISTEEFSREFYNPAAIGQSNFINARLISRHQWTGYQDAPSTQFLSLSNYFDRYRVGLALNVINDNLGAESNQMIKLKYAYHAFFNENTYLSLGLGTGIWHRTFHGSQLHFEQENDPYAYIEDYTKTEMDFDFGVEFTYKYFKLGVGSNHLSNTYEGVKDIEIPRHDYVYIQYSFQATDELNVSNGITVSHTGNIYHTELYSMIDIKQKIHAGLSYRLKEALVIMSQVNISDHILIGYAYDIGIGKMRAYNNGTHEILIAARINKYNRKKYKSPRFFD